MATKGNFGSVPDLHVAALPHVIAKSAQGTTRFRKAASVVETFSGFLVINAA
jgi:hypothetical protein